MEVKAFEYNRGLANASTVGSVCNPELTTHQVRDYGIHHSKTTFSIIEYTCSVDSGFFNTSRRTLRTETFPVVFSEMSCFFNGFGGIFEIWT